MATIDVIEKENLLENVKITGGKFRAGLTELADKCEQADGVRGVGLMIGIVMKEDAGPYASKIIDAGMLCIATAGNVIRFLPPLNITDEDVEKALGILEKCLCA